MCFSCSLWARGNNWNCTWRDSIFFFTTTFLSKNVLPNWPLTCPHPPNHKLFFTILAEAFPITSLLLAMHVDRSDPDSSWAPLWIFQKKTAITMSSSAWVCWIFNLFIFFSLQTAVHGQTLKVATQRRCLYHSFCKKGSCTLHVHALLP